MLPRDFAGGDDDDERNADSAHGAQRRHHVQQPAGRGRGVPFLAVPGGAVHAAAAHGAVLADCCNSVCSNVMAIAHRIHLVIL
eukprot:366249-Chlamydomonas_euryale.AAC.8